MGAQRDGSLGARVCTPLLIWSGPQLVDALFVVDFADAPPLNEDAQKKLFETSIQLSAVLSVNQWQADPRILQGGRESILEGFRAYAETWAKTNVLHASLRRLRSDELAPLAISYSASIAK